MIQVARCLQKQSALIGLRIRGCSISKRFSMESQIQSPQQFVNSLLQKHGISMNAETQQYIECLYESTIKQSEIDVFSYVVAAFQQTQAKVIAQLINESVQKRKTVQQKAIIAKNILQQTRQGSGQTPTKIQSTLSTPKRRQSTAKKQEEGSDQEYQAAPRKAIKNEEQAPQKATARKQGIKRQLEALNKQKCRFFPFCKKEGCAFFHPSEACAYFPHCQYGSKCLYIHQACKYGKNCRRLGCGYEHEEKLKGAQFFYSLFSACKNYSQKRQSAEEKREN